MSDNRLSVTELQSQADNLRADLSASLDKLSVALKPAALMKAAEQSVVDKLTSRLDPTVARSVTAHGPAILVAGTAIMTLGLGRSLALRGRGINALPASTSPTDPPGALNHAVSTARQLSELVSIIARAFGSPQSARSVDPGA